MPRRKLDILKAASTAPLETSPDGRVTPADCRIAATLPGAALRGWYRLKIVCPEGFLHRVGVSAHKRGQNAVGLFESVAPSRRFGAYIYVSPIIESLEFRLDFHQQPSLGTTATLRPISLLEYVWHSLRSGLILRPQTFLQCFLAPPEPFALRFDFPQPPRFGSPDARYQWWLAERAEASLDRLIEGLSIGGPERPPVSILMTVCDPRPIHLRKAIDSVRRQTTNAWELCIADDASTDPEVRNLLSDAAKSDNRIKVVFRDVRAGISAASSSALSLASSPFFVGLDHDDMLADRAVEAFAAFFGGNAKTRIAYSDEDKIDENDNRFSPYMKPDFSPELLYSTNYFNHLTAYHSDTVRQLGGWRSELDGAQDYDLILRVCAATDPKHVGHLPAILYHWRAIVGSTAMHVGFKPYTIDAGRRALQRHFDERAIAARVEIVTHTFYRARYALPAPPRVSIIIPFRDKAALLRQCVSSIRDRSTYRNYELILVDNASREPETIDLMNQYQDDPDIRVLRQPGEFNYAALNNRAAEQSDAEYLCLLNNDTCVISPDWLEDMIGYASQEGVGCVGAKLYYGSGLIQHAGVVLGMGGVAAHVFRNRERDDPGYFGRLLVASNYSAVTGACLVVRRKIYWEAGGLDENELPVGLNDIDFCLRVGLLGYRNVLTPFAELLHYESASLEPEDAPQRMQRFERDARIMRKRYGDLLERDPFYSPHLALTGNGFSLRVEDPA